MRNIWEFILASLIIVLGLCFVLGSIIKTQSLKESIDEDLVANMIVGSYVELSDNAYLICTDENIERIRIKDIDISPDVIGATATVDFCVVISTSDSDIHTKGRLRLKYSAHSPYKWVVDKCLLDESNKRS